jgi:hypothetical protein
MLLHQKEAEKGNERICNHHMTCQKYVSNTFQVATVSKMLFPGFLKRMGELADSDSDAGLVLYVQPRPIGLSFNLLGSRRVL